MDKRVICVALTLMLTVSEVVYAATPSDCLIPTWREQRKEAEIEAMLKASEEAQPISKVVGGARSCLPAFESMGIKITNGIPTSLGAIFGAIVNSLKNIACNMVKSLLNDSINTMRSNIRGTTSGIPGVDVNVGSGGVNIGIDGAGAVEDVIDDTTGLETDIPSNNGSNTWQAPSLGDVMGGL